MVRAKVGGGAERAGDAEGAGGDSGGLHPRRAGSLRVGVYAEGWGETAETRSGLGGPEIDRYDIRLLSERNEERIIGRGVGIDILLGWGRWALGVGRGASGFGIRDSGGGGKVHTRRVAHHRGSDYHPHRGGQCSPRQLPVRRESGCPHPHPLRALRVSSCAPSPRRLPSWTGCQIPGPPPSPALRLRASAPSA